MTRQDDGFGQESPLQRARRETGWTQAAAMRRFEAAVHEQGEQSPTGASLKRMFAYWERGERAVSVPAYRRAFVAIYGESAQSLGFEAALTDTPELHVAAYDLEELRRDLDRVLYDGATSETVLDDWEQLVQRYGRATRDRPAPLLLSDLGDDLGHLQAALTNCRSAVSRRRLTRVVAQMSGLMLLTLVKLDDRAAFRRWARTARVASAEAGDPLTNSWVLAQEAYGHFYGNDLSEAVAVAERAQIVAGTQGGGVGAPLAAALEARAYAAIGDRQATTVAWARAEEFVSHLGGDALAPSAFGYNEAQLRFHAGSAYTRLGELPAAFAAQEAALALSAPGDYTDRALTQLDRAACFAADGDPAAAADEISGTLLGLDDEQRRGIIDGRARRRRGDVRQATSTASRARTARSCQPHPKGPPHVIVVRPAAPDDIEQLLTLAEEMDRFYGAPEVESLELRSQQLRDALFSDVPAAHSLLAFDAEAAVGFATYSFLWPAEGLTRSLYLKELFVSQSHQRRGIGHALMESLFDVARKHNCSRVEWTTDTENPAAQAFYKTFGVGPQTSKLFYRLEP